MLLHPSYLPDALICHAQPPHLEQEQDSCIIRGFRLGFRRCTSHTRYVAPHPSYRLTETLTTCALVQDSARVKNLSRMAWMFWADPSLGPLYVGPRRTILQQAPSSSR